MSKPAIITLLIVLIGLVALITAQPVEAMRPARKHAAVLERLLAVLTLGLATLYGFLWFQASSNTNDAITLRCIAWGVIGITILWHTGAPQKSDYEGTMAKLTRACRSTSLCLALLLLLGHSVYLYSMEGPTGLLFDAWAVQKAAGLITGAG